MRAQFISKEYNAGVQTFKIWTNARLCDIIIANYGGVIMIVTVSDNKLSVSANTNGATLTSVKRLRDKREFLWQGSEDSWTEQDVVIFPFVARQKDGWYSIDGKRYDMPLHGVCRHADFTEQRVSDSETVLINRYNESTLEKYPFRYEYSVRFKVESGALEVTHTAKNVDDKLMYFMMGAHPAFNVCATEKDGKIDTGANYIDFLKPISPNYLTLEEKGHFITGTAPFGTITKLSAGKDVMVKYKTVMLTDVGTDKLALRLADGESVYFDFGEVDVLAFWSMEESGAYICIEPWHGAPDRLDPVRELKDKAFVHTLEPGKTFTYRYKVSFND